MRRPVYRVVLGVDARRGGGVESRGFCSCLCRVVLAVGGAVTGVP
eukprot:COSAG03_NODE_19346_length_338_cov_1.280335_1_plen_44_part_10